MKAFSIWDLLSPILLIAIIVHFVPQSEALTPLETCQLVKNGTFIADPSDCQGWYYCLNGVAYAGKCKTGLLYNSYTGSCDYPANVVCAANVTTMCTGLNAVYKRDPTNCQGYCYCTNGVTGCANCPTGQVFDLATTACVWPSADVICESDSPCLLAQNTFIKNPNSCAGWYRCLNGEIANGDVCNEGLYYDAFTGMCNNKDVVGCNVVTTVAPTDAPTINPSQCGTEKFIADPKSCRGYFFCVEIDNKMETHWGECPAGSQFDATTQKCINPYNVSPPCGMDRCAGMSVNFMAVPKQDCKQYVICNNGVSSKKIYTCETVTNTKYVYFNEKTQSCQEDPIMDQAICTYKT